MSRTGAQNDSTRIYIYLNDVATDSSAFSWEGSTSSRTDSMSCAVLDRVRIEVIKETPLSNTRMEGWAWQVEHDRTNRVVSGDPLPVSYTYDNADQLLSITYPDSTVVTYTHDDLGRVIAVGDGSDSAKYAQVTYTDRDQISQLILGDSLQTIDYVYNERGWLEAINPGRDTADASGTGDLFLERLYYYYDTLSRGGEVNYNGNITGQLVDIGARPVAIHHYTYDGVGRIDTTFLTVAGDTTIKYEVFQYDKNGNFTARTRQLESIKGASYTYQSNSNLLDTVASSFILRGFDYDANGNVSFESVSNADFIYDLYSQLDSVHWEGGQADSGLSFTYNADGLRIRKEYSYKYWSYDCGGGGGMMGPMGGGGWPPPIDTIDPPPADSCLKGSEGSGTLLYYVRGKGKVLAEYDVPLFYDDPIRKYIYLGDQRIAMIDDNDNLYYYINDHLGSARLVIDTLGNVKDWHSYYTFGDADAQSTSTNQPRKYTGKPFDDENDLDIYYYGARYYDPEIGRFLAVDPLHGKYPEWGPYVYVRNNPLSRVDPDGLTDITVMVQRNFQTKRSTHGTMGVSNSRDDRSLTANTLEPPRLADRKKSRLPAGEYGAFVRPKETSKHSVDVIQFKGTPTDLMPYQIHPGNTPDQTTGCILPGSGFTPNRVRSSRAKVVALVSHIRNVQQEDRERGEETTVTVIIVDEEENDNESDQNQADETQSR